eukprot:jgi/Ulvmu1/531/UM001_0539.1
MNARSTSLRGTGVKESAEAGQEVAFCGVTLPPSSCARTNDSRWGSTQQQDSKNDLTPPKSVLMNGEDSRLFGCVKTMGSAENLGLLFMAIYAFSTALTAVFVKLAAATGLSTWEIIFVRSVVLTLACVVQLVRTGDMPWGDRVTLLNMRGILGVGSLSCLFFAMRHLPLADAIVFTFLAPVLITIASPFVLQEKTGNQWLPVLGAVLGVLLICQPSFLFGQSRLKFIGVLFGVMHASFSAAAKMLVRALKEENTEIKMLYLAVYSAVVSGAALLVDVGQWITPNWYQAALLLGCGLTGIAVQAFLTLSLERVKAAAGMNISYSAIIWSELAGICLFNEIPNAWAIVGTVAVLCSTVASGLVQNSPGNSSNSTPGTPATPKSMEDTEALLPNERRCKSSVL